MDGEGEIFAAKFNEENGAGFPQQSAEKKSRTPSGGGVNCPAGDTLGLWTRISEVWIQLGQKELQWRKAGGWKRLQQERYSFKGLME
ncbi:hypothetical protein Q7C36_015431 [Tachysurus vachellii]|uniref:Uncharacterized protein n=1 Tax=Tachysurus vachellii TaxID=175792 RepID=A0AA88MEH6_TACVA|nr:hypothetical protein Q7C36_015431 [Tachysurus vachellii]